MGGVLSLGSLACCMTGTCVSTTCAVCPSSCAHSGLAKFMYALVLLITVVLACVMLAPGIETLLNKSPFCESTSVSYLLKNNFLKSGSKFEGPKFRRMILIFATKFSHIHQSSCFFLSYYRAQEEMAAPIPHFKKFLTKEKNYLAKLPIWLSCLVTMQLDILLFIGFALWWPCFLA